MERIPSERPIDTTDMMNRLDSTSRLNQLVQPLNLGLSLGTNREVMASDMTEIRQAFGEWLLNEIPCSIRGTAYPRDENVFYDIDEDDSEDESMDTYEEYEEYIDDEDYDEMESVDILDEPFVLDAPSAFISDIVLTEKSDSNEQEIMLEIYIETDDEDERNYFYLPFSFIEKLNIDEEITNPSELFNFLTIQLQEHIKNKKDSDTNADHVEEFMIAFRSVRTHILETYQGANVNISATSFYRLRDDDESWRNREGLDIDWTSVSIDKIIRSQDPIAPIQGEIFDVAIPELMMRMELPKRLSKLSCLPTSKGKPVIVVRNEAEKCVDMIYLTDVDEISFSN